jgi:large subunit ribosomal protein L15
MATLNQLSRPKSAKRPYRRVGRGQSSSRGKTSGRGTKGQNARAGRKKRPELRDIIKKLPKRRGYGKNRGRTHVPHPDAIAISLSKIEKAFDTGAQISRETLIEKGLISKRSLAVAKIVGGENFGKKVSVTGIKVSGSARAAIEKAGGSVAPLEVARGK